MVWGYANLGLHLFDELVKQFVSDLLNCNCVCVCVCVCVCEREREGEQHTPQLSVQSLVFEVTKHQRKVLCTTLQSGRG